MFSVLSECVFRGHEVDGGTECSSPDLIHPGFVPRGFCEKCPAVTPPVQGFIESTEQLLRRVSDRKPRKPCGGCGSRAPGKLQFVWCYFEAPAKLDELRFSMRSVAKHYQGEAEFVVVGDCPPFAMPKHIPTVRKPRGKGFHRGLADVMYKMSVIAQHEMIGPEFVWMMDDVFFVRDVSYADLKQPRAAGKISAGKRNRWQRTKTQTAEKLQQLGLSTWDFATHLPHWVRKSELAEMMQQWNPLDDFWLWEVVYGNTYRPRPSRHTPFLRRIRKPAESAVYDRWANSSHVFNLCERGWCVEIRDWLRRRMPEPLPIEVGVEFMEGVA